MPRPDARGDDQLRPVSFTLGVQRGPAGSVMITQGNTVVLCAATVADKVPGWLAAKGRGWVTAEYSMLPGSVSDRAPRKQGGRDQEIQRLVGRSLRAAVDLERLGERLITIDCDVIQADAGTRVASITAGWIALRLAVDGLLRSGGLKVDPIIRQVAAVSVAVVDGWAVLDPVYEEDVDAQVDANFVMSSDGLLIEVQSTAEGLPFSRAMLDTMLDLAGTGTAALFAAQTAALTIRRSTLDE
ncbi:MAG TPA: ribonuclease PH [Myxococcota bacterium]|nr:ribonuclease PH [Myxococcota bacterium]